MDTDKKVRTRFAPSPTGLLHSGNYRTAIYSYLFARQNDGQFILRIEDTDRKRSQKEYEANILDSLNWLGLEYDELCKQSDRLDRHTHYLEKLIDADKAYISKEEAKDGSGVVKEIVRFRNPNKVVQFDDSVRGNIEIDTTDLGDFVIAKNVREPLFHLAVVVDDAELGITHIIRGEDHISNTPRHILLYEALGFETPTYAHLPLVLNTDKSKLSKRKGAQPLTYYREEGYLPEALMNFLAMLGWNDDTDDEVFTKADLLERFDIKRIQKGGAIFNIDKLEWLNKEHMKRMPEEDRITTLLAYLPESLVSSNGYNESVMREVAPIVLERITHFGEVKSLYEEGELDFYFKQPEYEASELLWKKDPSLLATKKHLEHIYSKLSSIAEGHWKDDIIKKSIWEYAEKEGRGNVLWPLRYALSGRDRSPDPIAIVSILGQEETLRRISYAIEALGNEEHT